MLIIYIRNTTMRAIRTYFRAYAVIAYLFTFAGVFNAFMLTKRANFGKMRKPYYFGGSCKMSFIQSLQFD
jgi:hypothetical protein